MARRRRESQGRGDVGDVRRSVRARGVHCRRVVAQEPSCRRLALLGHDAVSGGLECFVAGDAGCVGDPSRLEAHEPFAESRRQPGVAVLVRFRRQRRWVAECLLLAADSGFVLAPVLLARLGRHDGSQVGAARAVVAGAVRVRRARARQAVVHDDVEGRDDLAARLPREVRLGRVAVTLRRRRRDRYECRGFSRAPKSIRTARSVSVTFDGTEPPLAPASAVVGVGTDAAALTGVVDQFGVGIA